MEKITDLSEFEDMIMGATMVDSSLSEIAKFIRFSQTRMSRIFNKSYQQQTRKIDIVCRTRRARNCSENATVIIKHIDLSPILRIVTIIKARKIRY